MGNSRYLSLTNSSSYAQTYTSLAPGRYQLTWWQKAEIGTPLYFPMTVGVTNYPPSWQNPVAAVNNDTYYNSGNGIWEQETALLLCDYGYPTSQLFLMPGHTTGASFGIDNVQLVSAPINPAVSPSNSTVVPSPNGYTVSWNTPADPTIASICVRYSPSAHPISPTDGMAVGTIPAVPGTRQVLNISTINWQQQNYLYFSIFGIKTTGAFTPPDLVRIQFNTTAPNPPQVSVNIASGQMPSGQWSASDSVFGIYQYKYAVGTAAGLADVVPWTTTTGTAAALSSLPASSQLYLSVTAENGVGTWSPTVSQSFQTPANLTIFVSSATSQSDGTVVTVSGRVSAVFQDCCYIQDMSNRARGIKILGFPQAAEGQMITVTGPMSTVSGERVVQAHMGEILPQ